MSQKHILSPEQDKAANPSENVWVQANAGTGKTSVLVQRLMRILFRANGDTGILCLTYTNAAAGEMRNRILKMLRRWAMASDDELSDMLDGIISNAQPTAADLAHARDIFFKYIDNPEILKIKTIHGFCEEILRRFPIEAGVNPTWTLISGPNQKILLQETFDRMIKTSAQDEKISNAFARIIERISEYSLSDLLDELTGQYKTFFQVENTVKYREYFIDTITKFLKLDLPICTDFDPQKLKKIIERAKEEINSSKKPAKYLINIVNITQQYIDTKDNFSEYTQLYLKKDFGKIQNISEKDYLYEEQDRVYNIMQRQINQEIFDDTIAMFDLAAAFANSYKTLKQAHNVLDFDDLILYTQKLFSRPDTMGWVLSQLDLSLNHILVDEAQDTSPQQWSILRMMAGDFFADGDTADNPHSIFIVGDSKQSIYGFQGADSNAFASSRDEIKSQISNNMRTICEIPLAQSFRSTKPILNTVDWFFESADIVSLANFRNNTHKCFRADAPGLVEIHPLVSQKESEHDIKQYIDDIAAKIKTTIDDKKYAPGDIMVLVQRRWPMAPLLTRALKKHNIPVAGSDRIVLPSFPAIRDLLNLVRFCINPDDDYSLCCTLKSPLFRLTERDILNLCTARTNAIKQAKEASTAPVNVRVFDMMPDMFPEIYDRLSNMLNWAATMGPYSFFTNVLNAPGGRESIIAAMGDQVIDPLEEFMTICLAYERTQPGTMRHFLKYFITGNSEIKRDMEEARGVRIVTIHGSKGLEAPVVFLIDTTRMPESDYFTELPHDKNAPYTAPWIWVPRATPSEQFAAAKDYAYTGKIAEHYRLLYVAMTRARDELYIMGHTAFKNAHADAWHTRLWDVLGGDGNEPIRITNVTGNNAE